MLRFSCEKALLNQAISISSRAAAPKSTVPAAEGLLIQAAAELSVTGYNLEMGIRTTVPAEITRLGSVVLPCRLLGDIVRSLPDDVVSVEADDKNLVKITCGAASFELIGIDADEYPSIPSVDGEESITLEQGKLRSMISETLFAVSDSDVRPVHTGSLFDLEGDRLTVVSVDGYRLALRREQLKENGLGLVSFVVPGSALSEVEKICADSEDDAVISVGEKMTSFEIGSTTLICRRLEGEFLNYRQAISTGNTVEYIADRRQIVNSVERVSLLISDRIRTPLHCHFSEGKVQFTVSTTLGQAEDTCPLEGEGDLRIGFNNRYLQQALKTAPVDSVKLMMKNELSPCIIVPVECTEQDRGTEKFLYMVLPVRLR